MTLKRLAGHSRGEERRTEKEGSDVCGLVTKWLPSPLCSGWSAFAIRLLIWCVLVGAGYTYLTVHNRDVVGGVANFTAEASSMLVRCFGGSITVESNQILYNGYRTVIVDECLGGIEAFMLVSAMLAVTVPLRQKLYGAIMGVGVVYLYNVVRIAALTVAGSSSDTLFTFLHIYLGQATLLLLIAGIWLLWLRYATR